MFKKVISVFLVAVISFCFLAVPAAAADTSRDLSSDSNKSELSISGTTATCKSIFNDTVTYTSITAVQTLEKKGSFWSWSTVGSQMTRTMNNSSTLSLTTTKPGLTSGTYRVKTVFTVVTKGGATETATAYSGEGSI
ncbi:MAG: hypothetical protein IJZ65_07735 [Ruminiclostridium sp.]|nr:hypothetical protein [Ruminiclostridium sp.]